jgi:hypothetical protein
MRMVMCIAAGVPPAQHEAEAAAVRWEVINFHGKMVLLLNYNSINYIGLTMCRRLQERLDFL